MAKHDILLYNSTSSVFETNLSSNTARIKGNNSQLFSVISGSTELLKVDTTVSSVTLASSITASGNISGSLTSTASFAGRLVSVGRLSGDASSVTGVDASGQFSGSAQFSVSGAFDSGFRFGGSISGSSTSTGSFSHIFVSDIDVTHSDELVGLINVSESAGTLSGSTQIASEISGAFQSGFQLLSNAYFFHRTISFVQICEFLQLI